jgi:serine/threonine protein kinase
MHQSRQQAFNSGPAGDAESVEPSALAGLSREKKQRLSEVLDNYLRGLERGLAPDIEKVLAANPDLAEVLGPYLESLTGLHDAAAAFGKEHAPAAAAAQEEGNQESDSEEKRLGDFVLLHEIGRGGMGVVYEARQISLARRVALKVLPFAAVLDARQIARFKNEAQAAAQLQHPNIVPVYAVGAERGVHYYAMQFIDGQPLDRAIAQLRTVEGHGNETLAETAVYHVDTQNDEADIVSCQPHVSYLSTKWTSRRAYFETVMRLGIQAAEALQAAHSLGIVHRDIKPSNLLLDDAGKLWITDFGLARCQGDLSLTQTGDVVGTRQYMSPEQALGQAALVDQRTDVYSLGATLYELLTLRPAFEATDGATFLKRLDREDPPRIRSAQPSVPHDLETVVNKAMARERDERYLTAQELADDLRRLIEGKPPVAQRPTLLDRGSKLARRHRAAVAWGMAAAIAMMVALAIGLVQINRARTQAEEGFARAEENLRLAQETVDHFGSRFAERLGSVPGAEPVRHDLLQEMLAYYQRFIDQAGDSAQLRADRATTYGKIGSLNDQAGQTAEAIKAHEQSIELLANLVAERPDDVEHRSQLAVAYNNLALALGHADRRDAACDALEKAIALQLQLIKEAPAAPRHRIDLALSHNNLGSQLRDEQLDQRALAEFREAIRLGEEVLETNSHDALAERNLAAAYNNLAALDQERPASESVALYGKAAALQRRLMREHPPERRYRSDLAATLNNLGAAQSRSDQLSEAAAAYREAIDLQTELLRIVPLDRTLRRDLAVSYNNLGLTESRTRNPEAAQRCFRNALGFQQQLVAEQPGDVEMQSSLGGMHNNLGIVLESWGRQQEAAASFAAAIEHQRAALAAAPNTEKFRTYLSKHYFNCGRALRGIGNREAAVQAALARKQLWPRDPQRLLAVAEELALAGDLPLAGEPESNAARCRELAIKTLQEAVAEGLDATEIDKRAAFEKMKDHPEFSKLATSAATRE